MCIQKLTGSQLDTCCFENELRVMQLNSAADRFGPLHLGRSVEYWPSWYWDWAILPSICVLDEWRAPCGCHLHARWYALRGRFSTAMFSWPSSHQPALYAGCRSCHKASVRRELSASTHTALLHQTNIHYFTRHHNHGTNRILTAELFCNRIKPYLFKRWDMMKSARNCVGKNERAKNCSSDQIPERDIALFYYLLCLTPLTEGFFWDMDNIRKILLGRQRMAKVQNGEEILPKASTPRVGRTTDRFAIAKTRT